MAKERYRGTLEAGREICCYTLEQPLGAGGMGEVWVAKHRMLNRPAAVKMIRPQALGSDKASQRRATRRFVREARATAALRSHHTIDLYDFGITEEGAFYYIMELLEGLGVGELVQRFGKVQGGRLFLSVKKEIVESLVQKGLVRAAFGRTGDLYYETTDSIKGESEGAVGDSPRPSR